MQPGKKYNFSAYVKITDIHSSETKYGAQIAAIVTKSDNTTATYYSEMLNDVTNGSVDNGWRRLNVAFTLPQNTTSTKLVLYLKYATGTLYYDAVQLEDGDTFNRFNLLENASFEENLNIYPPIWSGNSLTVNDDRTNQNPQDRSYCFKFVADQNAEKSLTQDINISGFENDTYILSGWLKSNRIKSGIENVFGFDSSEMIIAQVHYSDGSALTKHIDMFNDCVSDWQYCSGSFDLSDGNPNYEKIPVKITITLRCAYQANDC